MEGLSRKPFQGIINIIRFNWHYYLIVSALFISLLVPIPFLSPQLSMLMKILAVSACAGVILSLFTSYYIYDHSGLYSLSWISDLQIASGKKLVNIHTGFDETSMLLKQKFPDAEISALDFYDKRKHTEISIERARKAYSPYPGTIIVDTDNLPLNDNSIDYIFLILAAHEIRKEEERINFFIQLKNCLHPDGKIILTEHLRDFNNFIAYNIGFLHFYSPNSWKNIFEKSGLTLISEKTKSIYYYIYTHKEWNCILK